jgi:nicotinamidase-related amidase
MKDDTTAIYERAQLGGAIRLGQSPAILVVDFSNGFSDRGSRLGSDLDAEIAATRRLLDAARAKGLPIVFTTVALNPTGTDAGLWVQKIPALLDLQIGSEAVEIDARLDPQPHDTVIVKKAASAFFGTNLSAILTAQGVDTVVLCGATTSGCIRATAIDLLQYGFPAIVPRECVGDRAVGPHQANLVDIQAKYADVVSVGQALEYVSSVPARTD